MIFYLYNFREEKISRPAPKRKIRSLSLATSEYASGLEPLKKKKKKNHLEDI